MGLAQSEPAQASKTPQTVLQRSWERSLKGTHFTLPQRDVLRLRSPRPAQMPTCTLPSTFPYPAPVALLALIAAAAAAAIPTQKVLFFLLLLPHLKKVKPNTSSTVFSCSLHDCPGLPMQK